LPAGAVLAVLVVIAPALAQQCPPGTHELSRTREGSKLTLQCACNEGSTAVGNACLKATDIADRLGPRLQGSWSKRETLVLAETLGRIDDPALRTWMIMHLSAFHRWPRDDGGQVSADGTGLKFRDSFFVPPMTDAMRDNLLAFEAGKSFWNATNAKMLADGRPMNVWFSSYFSGHAELLSDLRHSTVRGADLGWVVDPDMVSGFADLFRAEALHMKLPKDAPGAGDWRQARDDFRSHVLPLIR
jgi:hypothetical protein